MQASIGSEIITPPAEIKTPRPPPPGSFTAGDVGYSQCDAGNSYAIVGGDANGKSVTGVGGNTLVLSNQ